MAKTNCGIFVGAACLLAVALVACGEDGENVGSEQARLVAVCAENLDSVPAGSWVCGSARTVECDAQPGTASPAVVYVVKTEGCQDQRFVVAEGPFAMGEREIVVSERLAAVGSAPPELQEVCRSRLTVIDTTPPVARPTSTRLWPPNHSLHAITAEQCAHAVDACDPELSVHFTSATSDELVDDVGDGSHEPDIVFAGPGLVSLRAERQGGGNGRVYTLGWQAVDASGNVARGACTVEVPHDQSGRAAIADPSVYATIPG